MNYGNFNVDKERAEQSVDDWKFGGASQPGLISIPELERDSYLPLGEVQATYSSDTYDCATRSPVNKIAADFTYGYINKIIHPDNRKWLLDKGYVVNGKVDFSDRFIAILSGTTRQGNSLKAPIDTIRKCGLIPKAIFPLDKNLSFEEYYDPSKITNAMKDLGAEFARRFFINYEQVYEIHFGEALRDDMLCVAAYAWPTPINGVYPRADFPPNHAFLNVRTPKYEIFDNYEEAPGDFIKQLASDYKFFEYGYRVFISAEDPNATAKLIPLYERLIALLAHMRDLLLKPVRGLQRLCGF